MKFLLRLAARRCSFALLLGAAIASLSGCHMAILVGGASAAYVATDVGADRRLRDVAIDDEHIGSIASDRISVLAGDRVHVNITSFNYVVLLTGEAPDATLKGNIEKVVGEIPRVRNVVNEIQITAVSSIASRSNDSYLTSKVKSNFFTAAKFSPGYVKVVTEDESVYLFGLVTRQEADAATEIARSTTGVQKVVRMFEFLGPMEPK